MNKIKRVLTFFVMLGVFACGDEVREPAPNGPTKSNQSQQHPNARTPEGGGSGSPTNPGQQPSGYALSYQGNGKWSGNFAACNVWFQGPTPTQLDQGIKGEWPVICANPSGNPCYPDSFVVYGNGSGFTVLWPMCGSISTVSLPLYTTGMWTMKTRNIQTLSGGNCSLNYSGKVVLNAACRPIIIDIASTPVPECGGAPVE